MTLLTITMPGHGERRLTEEERLAYLAERALRAGREAEDKGDARGLERMQAEWKRLDDALHSLVGHEGYAAACVFAEQHFGRVTVRVRQTPAEGAYDRQRSARVVVAEEQDNGRSVA